MPVGQSLSSLHWTHTLSRQNGAPGPQFLSLLHWTHRSPLQIGVPAGQSLSARQTAHSPLVTLQSGAPAGHPAFDVHPARHVPSLRQIGVPTGQSTLLGHCTHRPLLRRQNGAAVPQWLLFTQATHCFVVGSQIGRLVPAQSGSPTQPTHAPVAVSHLGASPEQEVVVQAGRHTWSRG